MSKLKPLEFQFEEGTEVKDIKKVLASVTVGVLTSAAHVKLSLL